MPNNNIKVLSTRPLREQIIQNAAFKGITIDTASFIETEAIQTTEVAEKIAQFATQKAVAVFTSMNAVEAVTAHLTQKPDWKIFCMGGFTRELCVKFFGEKAILASGKNATALAEKIVLSGNIKEVLFFSGDQRMDELPETLQANQVAVTELVVYNTILTPKAISENYDGIVFFSPSSVHSFFSENTISIGTILFSIGKTTTATIRTYVTNDIITSEWPGKEQMIEQIIQYFNKVNA